MKKLLVYPRMIATFAVVGFALVIAPLVAAQSTTINLWVGPPPVDVCPNIPGMQVSPPSGMIIDTNGDCVTPTPPPVDVCPNIAGLQTTIPSGYYLDGSGNCSLQPTPPVDVCPNIFGLQVVVLAGLIVDANGNCVTPPIDECPNIPGNQATIPAGMVLQNNACITPPGTVSPPTPTPTVPSPTTTVTTPPHDTEYTPTVPSSPGGYTGPDYKNVPAALDPVLDPLVKLVPKDVRRTLQQIPQEVARTVPYYIVGVLGLVAGLVIFQAIREIFATKTLILLYKRDKNIADQKDNFIALASHYLRTPLTLMRNGLDTVVALKELPAQQIDPLRTTVASLDANIKNILADVENNDELKGIRNPDIHTPQQSALRSRYFWGPVVATILFIWLANFLLGIVGNVDLGTGNMIFQGITIAAVIMVFYIAIRNHHIKRAQRQRQAQLIANEHAVDSARNAFIDRSIAVLQQGLSDLNNFRPAIAGAPSARFFDEGYQRFSDILQKFLLLGQIQTGSKATKQRINLRNLVDLVIESAQDEINAKKLTITNQIPDNISVEQNRALFTFVIQSLIDNAIKFNAEGGSVTLSANPIRHSIKVNISDSGIGIPKDKLPQLFKPFSRAGSAIEFNYEGLGFSLFLDKIITDYMGGTIKAMSPEKGGTSIVVTTDRAPSAS
ncbi:MAG: ATP-binding protein [Candidatus Saccharimonadales bacterium]